MQRTFESKPSGGIQECSEEHQHYQFLNVIEVPGSLIVVCNSTSLVAQVKGEQEPNTPKALKNLPSAQMQHNVQVLLSVLQGCQLYQNKHHLKHLMYHFLQG